MTSRIQPPPLETLDPAQQALVARTVRALGAPVGPRMVLLHHMPLAESWAALGDVLKAASHGPRARELAILVVARHWSADFEWHAHARAALQAGVPPDVVEAIRTGRSPVFDDPTDMAVHAYCRELLEQRAVGEATYQAAWQLLGTRGLVELTALIGHYTNVAMTLVAHGITLPAGQPQPFQDGDAGSGGRQVAASPSSASP